MSGDRCCFGDGRTQERTGEEAKGTGWGLAGEAGWGLWALWEAPVGREMERRSLADSLKSLWPRGEELTVSQVKDKAVSGVLPRDPL